MTGKSILLLPGALYLAGCASTPDAELRYYPTKTNVEAIVKQKITCNPTFTNMISSSIAEYNIVHSADYSENFTMKVAELDGLLNNSDVTVAFYDDGRLKSINAEVVGQGPEIIKGVASIAGSVFGVGLDGDSSNLTSTEDDAQWPKYYHPCKFINRANPKKTDAIIEIVFKKEIISQADIEEKVVLKPTAQSTILASRLNKYVPVLGGAVIDVTEIEMVESPVIDNTGESTDVVKIKMRKVSQAKLTPTVTFLGVPTELESTMINFARKEIKGSETSYHIPISKGAMFGTNSFAMSVSESGAIQSLKYGNTGATVAALGGANTLASIFKSDSETAKEEADRIVQEQRLLRCKADPENCE